MTQTVVLTKLAKYLEYYKKEHLTELEEEKSSLEKKKAFIETIDKLISAFNEGHCFGFSLLHAVKDYFGCLKSWEKALAFLANWDEDFNALSKGERFFFDEMIHAVALAQAHAQFYFPNMDQLNILEPDGYQATKPVSKKNRFKRSSKIKRSYFEVWDLAEKQKGENIKTIQKIKKISGDLTKVQLLQDLENLPEKAIILVQGIVHRGLRHGIRVGRKGTIWLVYDPNYDHKKLATLHKTGTLAECIDEIFKILGTSITIQVAVFDKKLSIDFPAYDQIVQTFPRNLIKNNGMKMLAQDTPNILLEIIKQINNTSNGEASLQEILSLLSNTDSSKWTTFHTMARYAPEALFEIFKGLDKLADKQVFLDDIISILPEKIKDGFSVFDLMAQYAPAALKLLFEQVNASPLKQYYLEVITQCLAYTNEQNSTNLQFIAFQGPTMGALVDMIENTSAGCALLDKIIKDIPKKSHWHCSALYILAGYSPKALLTLFNKADQLGRGHDLRVAILPILHEKNADGISVLRGIDNKSTLLQVVRYVFTNEQTLQSILKTPPDGLDTLLLALSSLVTQNKTLWQYVCHELPEIKNQVLNMIKEYLSIKKNEQLVNDEKNIRRAFYNKEDEKHRLMCQTSRLFYQRNVKTELYSTTLQAIEDIMQNNHRQTIESWNNSLTIKV